MLSSLPRIALPLFTYLTDPVSSFKGQFLKKPPQLFDQVKFSDSRLSAACDFPQMQFATLRSFLMII